MWWTFCLFLLVPVRSQYENFTTPENLSSEPCTDKNHLFLAPGVFTAGGMNRACLSRFYPEGPARLVLTLLTEDRNTVVVTRDLPPGDGGCVDISAPQLPNTKADLIINVRYPEAQCSWDGRLTVRLSHGRVVLVHTERSQYRPGDIVRIRVFTFKADLAPAQQNIDEIWIEGPSVWEGSRVNQWSNLRTRYGLAQVQYQLDELAPPGKWSVRAKLGDGSQGTAHFLVGNYDLPPFQLSVRHAPRVLRTSERLVWTVCVRYPWMEAVEGMLVIRMRGTGEGGAGVRTAVRLRSPRACHRHAAAARRLGLNAIHPPDLLIADFSFQEEGTKVWQNITVVSEVVEKPITLEFLTEQRSVISPGLPYKLKVKGTQWDEKPARNATVKVCRYPQDHPTDVEHPKNGSCVSAVTDDNGIARAMFTAGVDGKGFYRFEATLLNDSTTFAPPLVLRVRRSSSVHAALGPLKPDALDARTFVPLYLTLPNVTSAITVHFVVITRGGIIYRWGATTQCPIGNTASQIHTAPRYSKCDAANLASYDEHAPIGPDAEILFDTDDVAKRRDDFEINRVVKYRTRRYVNTNNESDRFNRKLASATTLARYQESMARLEASLAKLNLTPNRSYFRAKAGNNANRTTYKTDKIHNNVLKTSRLDNNIYKTKLKLDAKFPKASVNDVNASDSLLDRYLLRVMLPIKVTHQMCPDSHLIAYFYHNGELVSASKHFEMEECFSNKVQATWTSPRTPPGGMASLELSTPGPALCALSVLDAATKWLKPSLSTRQLLVNSLKRLIASHRNITEYDIGGDCSLGENSQNLPTNSAELTTSWMAAAGIRIVGGDLPTRRHCELPPAPLTEGDSLEPRSVFSEAWLWRLVPVGSNGLAIATAKVPDSITRFEANAMCVSKNGVTISNPAILQVFREFFVHADCPKRLRRGDTTILRYRIFNYLYEPLSVQVEILTDGYLKGPEDAVQTICVSGRSSSAKRVEVTALNAGKSKLIVRAVAINGGHCANVTNLKGGISDEVIIQLIVEPEGIPVQEHKSTLLCGSGVTSPSEVSWQFPPAQVVPRTEELTVWAAGDITGPLLADADDLVQMPRGCGEQNLARLATSLLALTLLDRWSAAAATARDNVARGFTRQLQYVHPTGGFSAFGRSDRTSSTWLTAFALKYMRRAHQTLWPVLPVPQVLDGAEQWLLTEQMENGCFRNQGQVFHRELKGGLNDETEVASIALTAYVITALMESTSPIPLRVLLNALPCLRALPPLKSKTSKVYAHALLAYALVRLRRYEEELKKTNEAGFLRIGGLELREEVAAVMELLRMAKRSGGYVWWETSSLSTSIEATGYALLALRYSDSALWEDGYGAVRWLAAQRNANGGFVATQDTLVALEALSAWSSLLPSSQTTLNMTAYSNEMKSSVEIHPDDKIPEVMKMGSGRNLKIAVQGAGCVLVQATRSYNTLSVAEGGLNKHLSIQLTVHTDGPFNCDETNTTCFCAAVLEVCVLWNGIFPEMALLEVSLPGGYGVDAKLLYSQLRKSNTLLRRIELASTNSRATLYLATKGGDTLDRSGHECFHFHVVGPRARTRPAYVKVQDYYQPVVNDTQIYTIPEECPPRIFHEADDYLPSYNLFEKSRSLTESGEIEITQEFSFDDIPDGIPLEDPIYDNLTKKEKEADGDLVEESVRKVNNVLDNDSSNNRDFSRTDLVDSSRSGLVDSRRTDIVDSSRTGIVAEDIHDFNVIIPNNQVANVELNSDVSSSNATSKTCSNNVVNTELLQTSEKISNISSKESGFPNYLKDDTVDPFKKFNDNFVNKVPISNDNLSTIGIIENDNQKDLVNKEISDNEDKMEIHDGNKGVDNPNLSNFHIIDSYTDHEVPSGIEGPVPVVVLPPPNFVPPAHLMEGRFNLAKYRSIDRASRRYRRRYPGVYG